MKKKLLMLFPSILAYLMVIAQAPTNDECTGAISLSVNADSICIVSTSGTNAGATQSLPPLVNCHGSTSSTTISNDVWYSFIATSTVHNIKTFGSSNFYPVFDLRSGNCNGINIDCGIDVKFKGVASSNVAGLTVGDTYFIRLYNLISSVTSTFTICITTPFKAAGNSQCNRAKMVTNYVNNYLGSEVSDSELMWTGDTATCNDGTISILSQKRTLTRINYFRQLVGLSQIVTFDDSLNDKSQQTALMIMANSQLSHYPPSSWKCYTSAGAYSAANSNLTLSYHSAKAITAFIDDGGPNNYSAGHRRWILFSKTNGLFGNGSTLKSSALFVINTLGQADSINYIAYPSAGFFPAPLVPPSNRWSFGKNGADFTNTTVQMTDNSGANVSVTLETLENGYGDNTIVWTPTGIITNSPFDLDYTVNLTNVVVSGVSNNYSYVVKISQIVYPPQCPNGKSWSENSCDCLSQADIVELKTETDLKIYPNPTTGLFNLKMNRFENAKIKIYNLYAQCIYERSNIYSTFQIDLNNQPSGIYFMSVKTNEGIVNKKIVVIH